MQILMTLLFILVATGTALVVLQSVLMQYRRRRSLRNVSHAEWNRTLQRFRA
jgi:hypothetical protein